MSRGTLLGVRKESEFAQAALRLAPGDVALLYTDGLFSMKSPGGERLSHDRLVEAFAGISEEKEMLPALIEAMQSQARVAAFDDDVAAIALHRLGGEGV